MVLAGLAAVGGVALAATAQHALVALAGFVVAGGGLALSAPTLFGVAGRIGGEGGRGAALSTVAILGYLGFLAGPPLIGAVSGASSLRGGFLFLCAVAVLLAACAPLLRRAVGETGGLQGIFCCIGKKKGIFRALLVNCLGSRGEFPPRVLRADKAER